MISITAQVIIDVTDIIIDPPQIHFFR